MIAIGYYILASIHTGGITKPSWVHFTYTRNREWTIQKEPKKLGSQEKDLYGWDIDPVAIEFCRRKFPQGHFEVKNSLNL